MKIEDIEDIEEIVVAFTGTTGDIAANIMSGRAYPVKSSFFKPIDPINPKKDAGFRAITIVTAPIAASIMSVTCSLAAIFFAFKSLYDLSVYGKYVALETLGQSGTCLLVTSVALLIAVIGPFVNLVDLIGSGIDNLSSADERVDAPYSASL